MMKILLNLRIVFSFLIVICFFPLSCVYVREQQPLPSFEGMEVNEDTIFLVDSADDNEHKIVAFDSRESKKIGTYCFKNIPIYGIEYDYTIAKHIYIDLIDGRFVDLDLESGKLKEMEIDFSRESFFLLDGKLWILPQTYARKGETVRYFVYTPETGETEWVEWPEGCSDGSYVVINDEKYLAYFFTNYEEPGVYNYTKDRIVDVSEINGTSLLFRFFGGYLCGAFWDESNELRYDVYEVDSLEPLKCRKVFTTDQDVLVMMGIHENEKNIFVYSGNRVEVRSKRDKYKVVQDIELEKTISYVNVCKDGYIWCIKEGSGGAYKISMEDFSVQVIQ